MGVLGIFMGDHHRCGTAVLVVVVSVLSDVYARVYAVFMHSMFQINSIIQNGRAKI